MRLAKLRAIAACAILASAGAIAYASDVRIAPIQFLDDSRLADAQAPVVDVTKDILDRLSVYSSQGSAIIKSADGIEAPPRSFLDASRLCQAMGYDFLLYGLVSLSDGTYSADIRLYDAERAAVAAIFYGKDDDSHYGRLINDIAFKILDYLLADSGWAGKRIDTSSVSAISVIDIGAGYWTPLASGWEDVVIGIAGASVSYRLIPVYPAYSKGSLRQFWMLGADCGYAAGMNEAAYEPFMLHSIRARLMAESAFELGRIHTLYVGLGSGAFFDIAVQQRKYATALVSTSCAPSLSAMLGYSAALDRRVSLGISTYLDVALWDTPYLSISPSLTCRIALGKSLEISGDE